MTDTNEEWFERAQAVIPGGVNSPVRAFRSVGGIALLRRPGRGRLRVGRRGQALHGLRAELRRDHPRPRAPEGRRSGAEGGRSTAPPTARRRAREVLLAEAICERVPSCEKVRMVNSGTEATMTAIRVARGFTGRQKVVKFAGNYHGHGDALLAAGGSGVATLGLSGSAGVPTSAVARDGRGAVQRGARARRRRRVRHRRAGRREHGSGRAGARLPRRLARGVRRGGRAARVRRGHHRVPPRRAAARSSTTASRPTSRASARSSAAGFPSARSAAAPT